MGSLRGNEDRFEISISEIVKLKLLYTCAMHMLMQGNLMSSINQCLV